MALFSDESVLNTAGDAEKPNDGHPSCAPTSLWESFRLVETADDDNDERCKNERETREPASDGGTTNTVADSFLWNSFREKRDNATTVSLQSDNDDDNDGNDNDSNSSLWGSLRESFRRNNCIEGDNMRDAAADLFFAQNEMEQVEESHPDQDDILLDALLAADGDIIDYHLKDRWVDFFCVVGLSKETRQGIRIPQESGKEQNCKAISCAPCLLDCYPKSRHDMEFPSHLPTFCFPSGCEILLRKINVPEPELCNMVLTSGNAQRLYMTTLTVYEQLEATTVEKSYWIPKCLVLLGHHPFFIAQSTILKELYYTVLSGTSPVPVERYIAHILHDIPYPTPKTSIEWHSWTSGGPKTTTFQLHHESNTNAVVLSLEPLFRTLSLSSILVLWATLLQEGKVVLTSQHPSLLTPISQALLRLLFPLEWQGLYIPILPKSTNNNQHLDFLECPVPYLVGLVATGFDDDGDSQDPARHHPLGVVWCDLDTDTIHLGWNDDGSVVQQLPALPEAASLILKTELEEVADPLYLPTMDGIKGKMTVGDRTEQLDNADREAYAHQTRVWRSRPNHHAFSRSYILSQSSKVPPRGKDLKPEDYVLSRPNNSFKFFGGTQDRPPTPTIKRGTLKSSRNDPKQTRSSTSTNFGGKNELLWWNSMIRQGRSLQVQADRILAVVGQQKFATPSPYAARHELSGRDVLFQQDQIAATFFDVTDRDHIMAEHAKKSFGEFFASILSRYKFYIDAKSSKLDTERFLLSLRLPQRQQDCVRSILSSQMFEIFLRDKLRRKAFEDYLTRRNSVRAGPQSPKTTTQGPPDILVPPPPLSTGIRPGQLYCMNRQFPDTLLEEECISTNTPTVSVWDSLCQGPLCSVFELW